MVQNKPQVFFTLIILLFGSILIFITPYGANTDEETHVARIWEMSSGHIIPNNYLSTGPQFPSIFLEMSYRQQVNLPVIDFKTWVDQMVKHIDWSDMINYKTRASYFPTLYIFQAFIMGITERVFDLPVLLNIYILRFSYLFIYALLIFFSIKVIPFGKWLIGTLAILPTCLIQASSISTDAINFGIPLLFLAWVIKIAKNARAVNKKEILFTCFLILCVFTLKPNSVLLGGLLFLLPQGTFNNYKKKLLIYSSIFFGFIMLLGYYLLISKNLVFRTYVELDPIGQFKTILLDPLIFIAALNNTITSDSLSLIKNAIGMTGYDYWPLPSIIYILTLITILVAQLSEKELVTLTWRQKIYLFSIGATYILSIFIAFFIVETSPGSIKIWGVQGRYFTPVIPVLLVALLFNTPVKITNIRFMKIFMVTNIVIMTWALFMVYHIQCGNTWFNTEVCTLPKYKNWAPETNLSFRPNISSKLEQTFISKCNRLSQLKFWINSKSATEEYAFKIDLMNNQGAIVRTGTINYADTPANGWALFIFSPINFSRNMNYSFFVTSNFVDLEQGINLGYTTMDEYPEGYLMINDQQLPGDLVFQYVCVEGLRSIQPINEKSNSFSLLKRIIQ